MEAIGRVQGLGFRVSQPCRGLGCQLGVEKMSSEPYSHPSFFAEPAGSMCPNRYTLAFK